MATRPTKSEPHTSLELTNKEIEEFQALYSKHFGATISREDALEQSSSFIELFKLVYKPVKKSDLKARGSPP